MMRFFSRRQHYLWSVKYGFDDMECFYDMHMNTGVSSPTAKEKWTAQYWARETEHNYFRIIYMCLYVVSQLHTQKWQYNFQCSDSNLRLIC